MIYKTRALRNLLLSAATLLSVLFLSITVNAQCVSKELKEQWRAGRYQQVVRPLMDCYGSTTGNATVELEYMLAKTWCSLSRHRQSGCRAYTSLKSNRGRNITVNGSSIDLDRDACCQLPEFRAAASPEPGVGVTQSFIKVPFSELIIEARGELGSAERASAAMARVERTTPIASKLSGRCLDILSGNRENAALLIQYDCHTQENQTWQLLRRDDGYYNIIAKHSGKCLDVNGRSLDNGVDIFQHDCHDGDNQRWRVTRTEDGSYTISAKHSGKCLDVSNGSVENLTHIVQWDCHGGDNQKWTIASEALDSGTTVGPPAGRREAAPVRVPPPPAQRRRVIVPPPPMRMPPEPL